MQTLKTHHPQIEEVVSLFRKETEPFRKVHRLIDVFEVIIKTHTAYIIGEYFENRDISDDIKGLFTEGLRTPSLGMWQLFNRVLTDELTFNQLPSETFHRVLDALPSEESKNKLLTIYQSHDDIYLLKSHLELRGLNNWRPFLIKTILPRINSTFAVSEFPRYFYNWTKKVDSVISLRNSYAHGATPHNEQCLRDIETFTPIMEEWLQAEWLKDTRIFAKKHTHLDLLQPMLETDSKVINLFPILKYENETLVFFNDLKKYSSKKISYLDYIFAEHIHDSIYYEAFLEVFKLEEWKQKKTNEFQSRIDELTENFKGRETEQTKITEFLRQKENYLFITGIPGIGKSALVANYPSSTDQQTVIIKYFIRRGTIYASPHFFLDYMTEKISPNAKKGSSLNEKLETFHEVLQSFSALHPTKQLILMIDGIDEAAEQSLTTYLPTNVYKNIKVIYSSRSTQKTEEFYHTLPVEHKQLITLTGLSNQNIRALLYEVVSKYTITAEAVQTIAEKSKGNPLYLKILCDAIERGEILLSDLTFLPNKIEDFYEAILSRFSKEENGDDLLLALFVISAAKDYLSEEHLQQILGMGPGKSMQVMAALREILTFSQKNTKEFQLFHESLREYLRFAHPVNHKKAERKILQYCEDWEQLLGIDTRIAIYPLRYYSTHLFELDEHEKLYQLSLNKIFVRNQREFLQTNQHSFLLMQQSMMVMEPNKISEFMHVAVENAQLHFNSNSVSLIKELQNLTDKEVEQFLLYVRETSVEEQITLYLAFLYYCLHEKVTLTKESIHLVAHHFEELMEKSGPFIALADLIPAEILFDLIVNMNRVGLNHEAIGHYVDPNQRKRNYVSLLLNLDLQTWEEIELYIKYFVEPSHLKEERFGELVLLLEKVKEESVREKLIDQVLAYMEQSNDPYIKSLLNLPLSMHYHMTNQAEKSDICLANAHQHYSAIHSKEKQADFLENVVEYYMYRGEKEMAFTYVKKAKDLIESMHHARERWARLSSLCWSCVNVQTYDDEDELLQLIEFIDPSMVDDVKEKLLQWAQRIEVDDIEEYIKEELSEATTLYESKQAYKRIAHKLYEFNKIDDIFEMVLSQFRMDKFLFDHSDYQDYKVIAKLFMERRQFVDAAEVAKVSNDESFQFEISLELLENHEYTLALSLSESLEVPNADYKIRYMVREYSFYKNHGGNLKAEHLFEKIKEQWSEQVHPLSPGRIMTYLVQNKLFNEANQCIELIEDFGIKNACKLILAKELIENDLAQEALDTINTISRDSYEWFDAACHLYNYYEKSASPKSAFYFSEIKKGILHLIPSKEKLNSYDTFLKNLMELNKDEEIKQIASYMMKEIEKMKDERLQGSYCQTLAKFLRECNRMEYFPNIDDYLEKNHFFSAWYPNVLAREYMKSQNYEPIKKLVGNSIGTQQRLLFVGLMRSAASEKDLLFIQSLLEMSNVHTEVRREMLQSLVESCFQLKQDEALKLIMNIVTLSSQDQEVFARSLYGLSKYIRFLADYHSSQKNNLLHTLHQVCEVEPLFIVTSTPQTYENLEEWIDKIADEDDREDIEIWAKRVKKGKMTADTFNERIQDIMDARTNA